MPLVIAPGTGLGGDVFLANTQELTGNNRFDLPLLLGLDGSYAGTIKFYDLAGTGFITTLTGKNGLTGNRGITLPDNGGYVSLIGDDLKATAVDASAGRIGAWNLTGQTANITSKKLTNGTPAGVYIVHAQLTCTAGNATAPNISFAITGTTEGSARTLPALISVMTGSTNPVSFTVPFYLASGDITWTVTGYGAGSGTTPTFALRIRAAFAGF
jgi:hypothetical protein